MNFPVQAELQGASIVAIGRFNPAIFQPYWFSKHSLIREDQAAKAQEAGPNFLIHKEATVFSLEWLGLQVTQERFSADTKDPAAHGLLRDLVVATFTILEHTPIEAFGLNRNLIFAMESKADWHALGDYYAPKRSWEGILEDPGLALLTITGRRKGLPARMQIRVSPTLAVENGVQIDINQHYDVSGEQLSSTGAMTSALVREWDGFLGYTDRAAQHLLREGLNHGE